jgi:hypothetical protein
MKPMTILRLSLAFLLLAGSALAADGEMDEIEENGEGWAEMKARRAHERASSDVIYQQEDLRALYYQHQAMIDLLKDMRDTQRETLRFLRAQAAEDDVLVEENG